MKHKNLVSPAALLILLISAIVLVTGCPTGTAPSGNNNAGGSSSEAPEPPSINEEETELTALLGKISLDKAVIISASEIITVSDLPAPAEATAVVTSHNTELIEYQLPDKLKIKKLPEATTEVKITITLTKNGTSKSRDFTVIIFVGGQAPEDVYLATLEIPTTVAEDFDLPDALQNTANTPINWTTENEKVIKIEKSGTDQKAIIEPDIVERKVKLTATVTASNKKEFTVTVLPIIKTETGSENDKRVFEFASDKLTYMEIRDGNIECGTLYSYTVNNSDADNKKITATRLSIFARPLNKWITLESYYNIMFEEMFEEMFEYQSTLLKGLKKLSEMTIINLQDIKDTLPSYFEYQNTYEAIFNKIKKIANLDMSYEAFSKLQPEQQSEILKSAIKEYIKQQALALGLDENASVDEILSKLKADLKQDAAQQLKEAKKTHTYKYKIEKHQIGPNPEDMQVQFTANVIYDPSVEWHENYGGWEYRPEGESPEPYIRNLYARKVNEKIIGQLDVINNHNKKEYSGLFSKNGEKFIFNGTNQMDTNDKITASITDNKNGTLTVTVNGGTPASTLKFQGRQL